MLAHGVHRYPHQVAVRDGLFAIGFLLLELLDQPMIELGDRPCLVVRHPQGLALIVERLRVVRHTVLDARLGQALLGKDIVLLLQAVRQVAPHLEEGQVEDVLETALERQFGAVRRVETDAGDSVAKLS